MGKYEDMREAALAIMSERGIRALTLPLLFERAHTGAGTFYHYFKDRDDLVNAVYEYSYSTIDAELQKADNPALNPKARFIRLCHELFSIHKRHPRELNFLYWYTFGIVEPEAGRCYRMPAITAFGIVIRDAQEAGLVEPETDPVVKAFAVRGLAAGVFWGSDHGIYEADQQAADRFAESAWKAVCEL